MTTTLVINTFFSDIYISDYFLYNFLLLDIRCEDCKPNMRSVFQIFSLGKGNYWTLDPNCEKMFDNGNFRRKRKRKSDSLMSEGENGSSAGPASAESSPKGHLTEAHSPSDRGSTPDTVGPSPCLKSFLTQMTEVSSSAGTLAGDTVLRPLPLGLPLEGSQRASPSEGFGPYSPNATVPQWEAQIPPPPPTALSSSPSHFSGVYTDSLLNHFGSSSYPGLETTGLVYPREGTEV